MLRAYSLLRRSDAGSGRVQFGFGFGFGLLLRWSQGRRSRGKARLGRVGRRQAGHCRDGVVPWAGSRRERVTWQRWGEVRVR